MIDPANGIEIARPQMPGLTPEEFRGVASVYLSETNLLSLLEDVDIQVDAEGLIEPYVSENLRKIFVVAEEMTPYPLVREKCGQMLGLWTVARQD